MYPAICNAPRSLHLFIFMLTYQQNRKNGNAARSFTDIKGYESVSSGKTCRNKALIKTGYIEVKGDPKSNPYKLSASDLRFTVALRRKSWWCTGTRQLKLGDALN